MQLFRRAAALAVSTALLAGGAMTLAPSASAVGAARCTYNEPDYNAIVDVNGVNYRTGPSTRYSAKGLLYTGDRVRVHCGTSNWLYTSLTKRSTTGLAKGTAGWVRSDMLFQLAG